MPSLCLTWNIFSKASEDLSIWSLSMFLFLGSWKRIFATFPFWTFPSQLINRCHLHSGFSHLYLSFSFFFFCPSLYIYFYLSPSFLFPLTNSFYFSRFIHVAIFLLLSFALHWCSFSTHPLFFHYLASSIYLKPISVFILDCTKLSVHI